MNFDTDAAAAASFRIVCAYPSKSFHVSPPSTNNTPMHKLSCPPFLPDLPDLEETSPMGAAAYRISPTTTNVAETTLSKMNANANVNTKGAKILSREFMRGRCCCCMRTKHSDWSDCLRTCHWCGRKHPGHWCREKGYRFFEEYGGARSRDRETETRTRVDERRPSFASQDRRSPGPDQRRSNAPRQDERPGRLPHDQADLAREHSQERYNRLAAWMDNNDMQIGELELTVTAQAKSIRDIRHELEQQRQQHTREIAELQRQRQEEIQQQQAHEISQLRERLERLEQQQQEHGQDMANLQEGVQDALPYVLMQQRQQQQQQQQQIQQREDKDKGEGCEPTLGSPILIE
ncbi:uncharacterized protein J3D65DRAFT_661351 [Phyllosticta citribraziliensis]|uniref:Uncharacterized protein n=1 Tax=Phyllosticta citribraziliensis TaxID=989973 RepID=A0ABR1LA22_9PEZI